VSRSEQSSPSAVVAALYVETGGVYFGLPDVDPWDEARDARLYTGPYPVVAHPPCTAWSAWRAPTRETMHGLAVGADAGCFEAALRSVRECGGVLEHPAHSIAWDRYNLAHPMRGGCWARSYLDPGWVCEVRQLHYGHRAEKLSWLYYVGPDPRLPPGETKARVMRTVENMGHRERSATPAAFRDALLSLARGCALQKVS
jgi:hypothetical protein